MPKVWTEAEIVQVIENEIREAKTDSIRRLGKTISDRDLAELVYCCLNEHHLIQDQP